MKKKTIEKIKRGMFYEDCRYHPMICVGVNLKKDLLVGLSLIDGKLSSCSYYYCGVKVLSPTEALRNRIYGLSPKLLESVNDLSGMHKSWHRGIKAERKRLSRMGIFFPDQDDNAVALAETVTNTLRRRSK